MISATFHHAAALAAIHAEAFPRDPWNEASFQALLGQPGVFGFIDERGGMVLLRAVADEAEILTIGVAVPRQGVGKTLMQQAIECAPALGAEKIHLEVAESNTAARALYKSLGFQQTGRRSNYYLDGGAALILTLSLSTPSNPPP